jgi:uncharacterized protein
LLGHPVAGNSWEGFVIENIISAAPQGTEAFFYRTSAGAEIDLVLALPGNQLWAIEIKRSMLPKVEKGFYIASDDIKPTARFVVYPGTERFHLSGQIEAISVREIVAQLQLIQ